MNNSKILVEIIFDIYHDVSDEYLQHYVDEACFRWNTRKFTEGQRFMTMLAKASTIVSYKKVINDGVIAVKTFNGTDYDYVMKGYIEGMVG